ncbi:putative toxin [Lysobacter sp. Root667]|uniref:putative toxin n=1 Tax=Lysobacter sp. Root667 TaxID=1736581 RepID=UPI001F453289|nr:putative toxin [Lysobacter sp. Root667]
MGVPFFAAVGGAKLVGAGLLALRLGKAGEDAVRATYAIGGRELIYVNGRLRIPDGINLAMKTVSEVKNVSYQAYTRQIRDYVDYARANGMQFNLFVRPGAQLSAPLEAAVKSGEITLKVIP